ncbi:MAG TPA: glycogen debranching N-terminal domain-containing protein [Candidatus Limnocylindrales bacterium]|nr:glycogen debranching N-terminal domain-containing protein [Candidatus Limnocylindrales bacterium]
MPVEIVIGPPLLSINFGATFMVTDLGGEIQTSSEQGIFCGDTRFVSYYAISANGVPWQRLTSAATKYHATRIVLTNGHVATEDGGIPAGTLSLTISRGIGEGIHEDLDLINHGQATVRFNLEIAMRSDFADLFEVKTGELVRRGRIVTEWRPRRAELETSYVNRDFRRSLVFRLRSSGSTPHYANGRITFDIELAAGAAWHSCCHYLLERDGSKELERECYHHEEETEQDRLYRECLGAATKITTVNEEIYRLYRQSVEDLTALRLYQGDDLMPAAGVPWFVAIFGRDALIASLQSMIVHAAMARGTLKKLAELQASEIDDHRDAEPGKIPHELRVGELAHFRLIPHTPYYGTADATPLYLIALHETWKWLGDDSLLREHRDTAMRCLEWIDRYGDLDGDGFQEYRTRSQQGYENMAWKDAGDAVVYADGRQVRQPKALCELQGYVFDAWLRMAEVFDMLGDCAIAGDLRAKAAALRLAFEEKFWCEELGFYAFALDPDKAPVTSIASNPGHCLWSGIVRPDRAERVVKRLLEPDMWSGWGVRTLSAGHPAYNPFSYQRGSVWPHDNGIIAMGFKRYGFHAEAASVARDISEAASFFMSHRLPELYAGVERQPGTFPVLYPQANAPQAWAAGTVFHLLQAILGVRGDAPAGHLYVDPALPSWLPEIELHGVSVGAARVDLRFVREDDRTAWSADVRDGTIDVVQQAWSPWHVE